MIKHSIVPFSLSLSLALIIFPITVMVGEEVGSKLVRFLSFVGAGVVCTKAINLWREYEHKQAIAEAAEKLNGAAQTPADTVNDAPVKS